VRRRTGSRQNTADTINFGREINWTSKRPLISFFRVKKEPMNLREKACIVLFFFCAWLLTPIAHAQYSSFAAGHIYVECSTIIQGGGFAKHIPGVTIKSNGFIQATGRRHDIAAANASFTNTNGIPVSSKSSPVSRTGPPASTNPFMLSRYMFALFLSDGMILKGSTTITPGGARYLSGHSVYMGGFGTGGGNF